MAKASDQDSSKQGASSNDKAAQSKEKEQGKDARPDTLKQSPAEEGVGERKHRIK